VTSSCATWQKTVRAENWDDVNVTLDVAVSYNEYVEGDKNLLPCAEKETEQLYQKITDINQEAGKE
jgi:hypothetical protein